MNRGDYFTEERRHKNMNLVLNKLNELETQLDFNSTIYTLADIIHSAFMNNLFIGLKKEERKELQERMNGTYNRIIDVLNEKDGTKLEDIIVLSNLIMNATEIAQLSMLEDLKKKAPSGEDKKAGA